MLSYLLLGSFFLLLGCAGTRASIIGIVKRRAARKIRENALGSYENALSRVEKPFRATLDLAEKYGKEQVRVQRQTVARFLVFLDRVGASLSPGDRAFLERLDGFSLWRFERYRVGVVEPDELAARKLKAKRANFSLDNVAFGLVGLFGAGAFDRDLLFSLLGNRFFSSDNGIFLDIFALLGIFLIPASAIGGFLLEKHGEKLVSRVRQYASMVEGEIERLTEFEEFCARVSRQISELRDIVLSLDRRAIEGMNELESRVCGSGATLTRSPDMFIGSVSFSVERDTAKLQEVSRAVMALAEISVIPVLDDEGRLSPEAIGVREKYGELLPGNAPAKG